MPKHSIQVFWSEPEWFVTLTAGPTGKDFACACLRQKELSCTSGSRVSCHLGGPERQHEHEKRRCAQVTTGTAEELLTPRQGREDPPRPSPIVRATSAVSAPASAPFVSALWGTLGKLRSRADSSGTPERSAAPTAHLERPRPPQPAPPLARERVGAGKKRRQAR